MKGEELVVAVKSFLKGCSKLDSKEIEFFSLLLGAFSIIQSEKRLGLIPMFCAILEITMQVAEGVSIDDAVNSLFPKTLN